MNEPSKEAPAWDALELALQIIHATGGDPKRAKEAAAALDRFRAEGVAAFVAEVRKMHDQWQHDHSYNQAMGGGYGNPLLALNLMNRIEKMARGEQP